MECVALGRQGYEVVSVYFYFLPMETLCSPSEVHRCIPEKLSINLTF